MKKLDQLISLQTKLELKRETLLKDLSTVEEDLRSVQKLRHEAEKIVSRLEKQQAKLDSLLEERIPKRKRKTSDSKEEEFVANLPQSETSDIFSFVDENQSKESDRYEESYQDV